MVSFVKLIYFLLILLFCVVDLVGVVFDKLNVVYLDVVWVFVDVDIVNDKFVWLCDCFFCIVVCVVGEVVVLFDVVEIDCL